MGSIYDLVLAKMLSDWITNIYAQNGTFIQFTEIIVICSTSIILSKHAIDVSKLYSGPGIYHVIEQYKIFSKNKATEYREHEDTFHRVQRPQSVQFRHLVIFH